MTFKTIGAACAVILLAAPAAHACPSKSEQAKAAAVTACAESATLQRGQLSGVYGLALFQAAYDRCMLGKGYKVKR